MSDRIERSLKRLKERVKAKKSHSDEFKGIYLGVINKGYFCWRSESVSFEARILGVLYDEGNLTYVKVQKIRNGSIVAIDATPFQDWYRKYHLAVSSNNTEHSKMRENSSKSEIAESTLKPRKLNRAMESLFKENKLLACVASYPYLSKTADGYILEDEELEMNLRRIQARKFNKR